MRHLRRLKLRRRKFYLCENTNPLDLLIYPGQNGSFTLYDDEGDNYNYEQGRFTMIRIAWDDAARRLTLYDRQGDYPGMPNSRVFRIISGDSPYDPLSAQAPSVQTVLYEGREISIDL